MNKRKFSHLKSIEIEYCYFCNVMKLPGRVAATLTVSVKKIISNCMFVSVSTEAYKCVVLFWENRDLVINLQTKQFTDAVCCCFGKEYFFSFFLGVDTRK